VDKLAQHSWKAPPDFLLKSKANYWPIRVRRPAPKRHCQRRGVQTYPPASRAQSGREMIKASIGRDRFEFLMRERLGF
jgi:hypothetical protein